MFHATFHMYLLS